MMADREGLFNAYPVEIGLNEQGSNKLACYTIRFAIFEEKQNGKWADVTGENMEITGWFYLETRDGRVNDFTVEALKAAFGWDGRDAFWLQDNAEALREHPVQLKLAYESYNGSTSLRVQFINPYGSTGGGVSRADDSARRGITNRLGPKLRAVLGASPASKPAGRPKPPGKKPPAPSSAPAKKPEATMDEAWAEFIGHCEGDKWDRQAVESEWFRIIAELFGGKQPDELSPVEWATMRDHGPEKIIPF